MSIIEAGWNHSFVCLEYGVGAHQAYDGRNIYQAKHSELVSDVSLMPDLERLLNKQFETLFLESPSGYLLIWDLLKQDYI